MDNKYGARRYALISAGAMLLLFIAVVGIEVILHPGRYLFEMHGDHIKNYYVVAYYVKYNVGLWFTGMNYPFGELALFSDNQPLLSFPLALIHHYVWPIAQYATAGQNLFSIFSLAIGAWIMQRILLRFHLPGWYTVPTALLVVAMSPQSTQFDFQYALSYTFAMLLPWLLLMKYFENQGEWKWWGAYVAVSLAIGFIHVYFLAMNGLFGVGVALVYALQEKQFKVSAKLLVGVLLPSALFLLFMAAVDQVPDRPQHPEGFFVHRANLEGIFFPYDLFYLPLLQKVFPTLQDSRQVSYAYAGIIGTFCVLVFVGKGLRYVFRKKYQLMLKPVFPRALRWSVWPAVGVLLFSMAIPLKYGLEEIVEGSPFLEQFRVLYRFAWTFYYVYASVVAYLLYALYRRLRRVNKTVAVTVLAAALFVWALDAVFFLKKEFQTLRAFPVGYSFNGQEDNLVEALEAHGQAVQEFQAIVPLPYFCIGSEKIDVGYPYKSVYEGMRVSLQTGLPLATMMMARTSQAQALAQAQLLSSAFIEKSLLGKLPNQKPFLLIVTPEKRTSAEEQLRQKASFLFRKGNLDFYTLPLEALRKNEKARIAQEFAQDSAALPKKGSWCLSQDKPFVWTVLGAESTAGVFGKGALRVGKGPLVLFNGALPAGKDTLWEASVWSNAAADRQLPVLHYEQVDDQGNVLAQERVLGAASFEVYGSWVKLDLALSKLPAAKSVKIWLEGSDIWASSFLLKPVGTGVYWPLPNQKLLYNNYIIQK
ncbi:hypothetical protein ACD591_06680 [Rufibacter glacialis]|uniref:DUF6311 domain-containing protein n=1 Tax=Rufibacter glacialis TaxID=1259555 RepID=A0A5M8QEF8_9BACT|nr:hypothetical protein [Rufibacter glacialis]KAA6433344.1 hypothetical protein FOE74_12735 [Rufibacter glacialis]GGK75148.1 hypothetical protein GCM10011405_23910 [Rufibacter glacialis]